MLIYIIPEDELDFMEEKDPETGDISKSARYIWEKNGQAIQPLKMKDGSWFIPKEAVDKLPVEKMFKEWTLTKSSEDKDPDTFYK